MNKEDNFKKIDEKFNELINNNQLTISSIEQLMIEDIKEYEDFLRNHIEALLRNNINEKELISKKNENGLKKDTN